MTAVTEVVAALVDAAFRSGGITDAQHADLRAKLDEPEPEPEAPQEAAAPVPVAEPDRTVFGTETFNG